MSRVKFVGDIDVLSDTQRKFVEEVLIKRGFFDTDVSITPVGPAGDNFSANVIRISAEKGDKKLKIIAKVAPTNETIRSMINSTVIFKNEGIMYNIVLPKFEEIQKNAGIPKKERFRFPACYGYFSAIPNEILLLEDLKESNFIMFHRFNPMSDECLKMSLKSLAQLHSLSFVLKKLEPELFGEITGKLTNVWASMNTKEDAKTHFAMLEQDFISIFKNDKYKKAVEGTTSEVTSLAEKLQLLETDPKYTVIQQGDCWNNNIMFRLKDDKVIENILIDYQLSRSASPADDILYLVLNCTNYEIRARNYYNWIDFYYTELDNHLAKFNLKAESVYPREQLDYDLKTNVKLGVAFALLLSSVQLREGDDILDMSSEKGGEEWIQQPAEKLESSRIINAKKESTDRFVEKATGIMDSVMEWGYL